MGRDRHRRSKGSAGKGQAIPGDDHAISAHGGHRRASGLLLRQKKYKRLWCGGGGQIFEGALSFSLMFSYLLVYPRTLVTSSSTENSSPGVRATQT